MKFRRNWADLFKLSFMSDVSPLVLETPKVVPVFKEDSKLDYSNYRPISLLSNIKKYLKKLCIDDFIRFSVTIALSATYSLDSHNSILHLMP